MEDNINNNDMDNQVLGLVKAVPNVLGQVYQDIAQPSVQAVGKALGTVFEFSTSFLLPVKLLNEKFKLNFTKRLDEYKKKLEEIPEEKICEVHPQIGTPIIEKLTYTTTDEIADLFTTLLANASNIDTVNKAHPSFVNMIEHLSSDEARLIKYLSKVDDVPYCSFHAYQKGENRGYINILDHATLLPFKVSLNFPNNILAYLSNLVSLGIISDEKGIYKVDNSFYDEICDKYELENYKQKYVPNHFKEIAIDKSYFKVTPIGKLFIDACISKSK